MLCFSIVNATMTERSEQDQVRVRRCLLLCPGSYTIFRQYSFRGLMAPRAHAIPYYNTYASKTSG